MGKCKKCGKEIYDGFQYCYEHNPNFSAFGKEKLEDNKRRKEVRKKRIGWSVKKNGF